MIGQLDGAASVASAGAVVESQPLLTSAGTPATASTALTDLIDAGGLPLFADGDELTISASKGGVGMPQSTFVVSTTGRTLGDFAAYLETVLGINTDPTSGGSSGVTIADGTDAPAGTLVITSDPGEFNAIILNAASITNSGGVVISPFSFSTTTEAVGGGETTSFQVFDSLGNPVSVRLRVALESKSVTGTVWRFYAESADGSGRSPLLGTGTISFDVSGQFVAATGTALNIDRNDTGAQTPLAITLDFSRMTGLSSPDGTSVLQMASQDGAPAGVLIGYSITPDGLVTGTFSNQKEQVYGQIALATFTNNEGLIALSQNNFAAGVNSGDPTVVLAQTLKAGSILSGALEQSNVEIAREFINLITASTGISSASRVVRVADDLLQELLLLAR